ncbi:MAG: 50S ribosomal protein L6 [Euryarchaeota archaeon]|nr:50S ribosomal protein L6 [Euryarchaeota archaeon]
MTLGGLIERRVTIPAGVTASIDGVKITIKGSKTTLQRSLSYPRISVRVDDEEIVVSSKSPRVREKAIVGTFAAHIANMVEGVANGFEYEMKIVHSHFPIKASVRGNKFVIENFLGERAPRKADILGDTKVQIKGNDVLLTGSDIELVSQTAANIERATVIKGFDSRVFQDGIYITKKGKRVSQ